MHLGRRHIGRDADIAVPAAQHQGHGGQIVAGVHGKAFGHITKQPLRSGQVPRGLFDAHDARNLRQAQHGVVIHARHGAARHVVQHHGQVAHGFGNLFEVLVLPFLRGLVVVGHHLQLAVCANAFGRSRQMNGLCRGIGAAARHDRHATGGLFNRHADDFNMLVDRNGGRLARGAHYANALGALLDVPIHQLAQALIVNLAIRKKRGNQGNNTAGDCLHRKCLSAQKRNRGGCLNRSDDCSLPIPYGASPFTGGPACCCARPRAALAVACP